MRQREGSGETLTEGPGDVATVEMRLEDVVLEGDLGLVADGQGLVIFAHGSGSSRQSPRNRFVAEEIRRRGVSTLLFDLLTGEEEDAERLTRHLRFDIDLLARRLLAATRWAGARSDTRDLRIGCFGSSTGAAAALVAAARSPDVVHAVVSRGGRPDLADDELSAVRAATLLIVGGADGPVIDMNRSAFARLRCRRELVIVPRATHLFEEPGTLEEVARLAAAWFERHLGARAAGA
jgi:putative phosphoribosyl transferase